MKLIFTLLLCLHALAVTAFAVAEPNIVMIMADDMGFVDIGCYGGERDESHSRDGCRLQRLGRALRCYGLE